MNNIDISIDLETFASCPNASIAQIGACYRLGPNPPREFFCVVDDPGGEFSPETIRWHAEQTGDTIGTRSDAVPLEAALIMLADFLKEAHAVTEGGGLIWTHATFDVPRLTEAYGRAGRKLPWHYRNCRDLRTLYDLAGGRPEIKAPKTHNALEDALRQLQEIEICRARITYTSDY